MNNRVLEDEELEFNAGESEVLQALDLIVPLMYVGETALVEVEIIFFEIGENI